MGHWSHSAVFYHIYPLGFCGAPQRNDFSSPPISRLEQVYAWLDHIQFLGANAIYFGPLFESSTHGYDTADYYHVDRRLGSDETLARLSAELHARGMHLIVDGVFNHVGRNFWAFRDVLAHREHSAYCDWFSNLRFDQRSPANDPFSYEGWNGHYSLVRLNPFNPAVREHLFNAAAAWIHEFNIDGIRLDAADCLDFDFMRDLARFCKAIRPDFWLMGEVIHGDYRRWANPEMLDSVTNYECYKGLYSSLNEHNYFEIAYALNRQFGPDGIYRNLPLYAFADNHDVNRVASSLSKPALLYPLYCLLFSMPGVPAIYYGSEWGLQGKKERYSDQALRPQLDLNQFVQHSPQPELAGTIARLAALRRASPALQSGSYQQVFVSPEQFAFTRQTQEERILFSVNASQQAADLQLQLPPHFNGQLVDLLNPGEHFQAKGQNLSVRVPPNWARILRDQ